MPRYDYECSKCHHCFETTQNINDDPLTDCPRCQGPVFRVLHPSPIIFRGSGFYVTDQKGS